MKFGIGLGLFFILPLFLFSQPMTPLKQGFIPVVTAAQGGGGSFWRSDVWITNVSNKTNSVELWVYTGTRGESTGKFYTLPANSSLNISNVVGDIGLSEGAIYLLNINATENVVVGSRTYTEAVQRAGGTYGQFIPSFPYYQGLKKGQKAYFPIPLNISEYRVNVGIANSGWGDAKINIKVFDGNNNQLYSNSITSYFQKVTQINAINNGLSATGNGYILIEVTDETQANILPYVSVVDYKGSNDPSFMFTTAP